MKMIGKTKEETETMGAPLALAAMATMLASLAGCLGTGEAVDPGGGTGDGVSGDNSATGSELRGGTIEGGAGVVEIWTANADGVTTSGCTGTVISPYALITAAHCFDRALGNTKSGLVDVQVSYTRNGTDWSCISRSEAGGRCSGWNTTWVRRLKGQNDVYFGHDFAVLLSTPDVNGPTWRGFTDFRNIDITVPSSGKRWEMWGTGVSANDLSDDGSMRHGSFKYVSLNRPLEILFTKATSSAGVCEGDSGGPLFRQTTDWVNAIGVAIDTSANCAASGKDQYAYVMTKHSIDVINEELASVHPGDIGCGGIGMPNKYRCFIPR